MCPPGIGVALYNGAQGLCYYASQAGRFFVSNGGIIVSAAVGEFARPGTMAVALGGTIASRASTWLTRRIDTQYHVHLADLYDWLLDQVPASVGMGYYHLTRAVGAPQREISTAFANRPQLNWINDAYVTELISPLIEEGIFRVGIQAGLGAALTALGVPAIAADTIAGLIGVSLFAGAHNPDPNDKQFRQVLISGIVFGLMMYFYGLPAAVLTHALNNFSVRMEGLIGV